MEESWLADLIEIEIRLLRKFLELLAREESLLVTGQVDALLSLSDKKLALYRSLQAQHAARINRLDDARISATPKAIREACEKQPGALVAWEQLIELSAQARRQNALNGRLISERIQQNQSALAALLHAGEQSQFYDAEGHTLAGGRGRHLGSA